MGISTEWSRWCRHRADFLNKVIERGVEAHFEKEIEHVKAALRRMERLEADLVTRRGESYGVIWKLTGSANLFGPWTEIDSKDLSAQLKDWDFEQGWVLTEKSKKRYFLVQEVLSFGMLRSVAFRRPTERLFSSEARPVQMLRKLRSELLGIEDPGQSGRHEVDDLEACVGSWKAQVLRDRAQADSAERNWILLQFVLSKFRSGIAEELGSSASLAPSSQAR